MKQHTRYTLEQAIQRVCFDQESIASMGSSPAYLWCWFDLDQCGEAYLRVGDFKLSPVKLVGRENSAWRYIAAAEEIGADQMMGARWCETNFYSDVVNGADRCMLTNGFNFHQRLLCRYQEDNYVDYWGEGDQTSDSEIIFAEPASEMLHLPVINPLVTPPNRYNKPGNQFSAA